MNAPTSPDRPNSPATSADGPMLSVVAPVYNEQDNLPTFYDRLEATLKSMEIDYEVILINDGSTDGTAAELLRIHEENPRWKYVAFSRNFGHQTAVTAGLQFANGSSVVVLDSDLQDPPELIEQLLEKKAEGFDVVYAVRTKRKEPLLKRAAYAVFYRLLKWMADIQIPLDAGDFCLMDRRVVDVLNSMPERSRFVRGLRSWAGFRQIGVEYERPARHAGTAKYTFRKLVQLAFRGFVSFSHAPLRLASGFGITLCAFSLLTAFCLCIWWASGSHLFGMHPRDSVGWTSLACGMLLLSGLQLLMLGIQGEYMAMIFDEVKGRPLFVVGHSRGFEGREDASEDVASRISSATAIASDVAPKLQRELESPSHES